MESNNEWNEVRQKVMQMKAEASAERVAAALSDVYGQKKTEHGPDTIKISAETIVPSDDPIRKKIFQKLLVECAKNIQMYQEKMTSNEPLESVSDVEERLLEEQYKAAMIEVLLAGEEINYDKIFNSAETYLSLHKKPIDKTIFKEIFQKVKGYAEKPYHESGLEGYYSVARDELIKESEEMKAKNI